MKNKIFGFTLSAVISIGSLAHAGVEDKMHEFLDNTGFDNNITTGGAYKSQQGGGFSGGQMYVRTGVKDVSMANIQLPSYKAGCGGIDIYTGGFDFLSVDEYAKTGKALLQNAPGVAFDLAMETVSPMIYNEMKNARQFATMINNANINSCEMATSLVGGLAPRTEAAQKLVCESSSTSTNIFRGWSEGRQGCGAKGQREEMIAKAGPEYKDMLAGNYNLVWKAMKKNSWLANDTALAEFIMSITGTIVVSNIDGKVSIKRYPAKIENQDLLTVLFEGGTAQIWKCDKHGEDECLNLTEKPITIAQSKGFKNIIRSTVESIRKKIIEAKRLDPREKGLINTSKVAIQSLAVISAVPGKTNTGTITLGSVADYIAYDFLLSFLDNAVGYAERSVEHIKVVQDNNKAIDELLNAMKTQREAIATRRAQSESSMSSTINIINEMIHEKSRQLQKIQNQTIRSKGL